MNFRDPLVTVNILSYNRKDYLKTTLQKVFDQDYKKIEVIVVDNASNDGSPEMVEEEYPGVRLIRLKKNIGIVGRNEGLKIARGDYILELDDDSYPLNKTITEGLHQFSKKSNLGIVAYNIHNLRTGKSQTADFNERPYLFIGCGALIKKDLLREIGYYNELYFIYEYELDYSLRCYDNGFEIIYLAETTVIHNQCMKSRGNVEQDPFTSEYFYYYSFISYPIFILQNFNFLFSTIFILKYSLNRLIICFKYPYFKSYCKALYMLISMLNIILRNREVARIEVQKFYNYGNMALIDRFYFPNFKKPVMFSFKKK